MKYLFFYTGSVAKLAWKRFMQRGRYSEHGLKGSRGRWETVGLGKG